jgi:hypothetical protein
MQDKHSVTFLRLDGPATDWKSLDNGAKTGELVLLVDAARGDAAMLVDKWENGDWNYWFWVCGPEPPTHYILIPTPPNAA